MSTRSYYLHLIILSLSQNDLPDDLISINDSLLRNTYVGEYMEFENNVSLSGITTPKRNSTFYDITDNSSDVSDWTSLNPHPMVNI